MISAVAGPDRRGSLTGDTATSVCSGEFDKVTPSPRCWIYPGAHGASERCIRSGSVSCNDYFYEVGYQSGAGLEEGNYDSDTGVEKLAKYAEMFGLDETYRNLEIPESRTTDF